LICPDSCTLADMFSFKQMEHKSQLVTPTKKALTDVKGYSATVVHFYNSG